MCAFELENSNSGDTRRASSRQFQYLVMGENYISVDFAREIAVQCTGMVDIPGIASNTLYGLEDKLLRILNII